MASSAQPQPTQPGSPEQPSAAPGPDPAPSQSLQGCVDGQQPEAPHGAGVGFSAGTGPLSLVPFPSATIASNAPAPSQPQPHSELTSSEQRTLDGVAPTDAGTSDPLQPSVGGRGLGRPPLVAQSTRYGA